MAKSVKAIPEGYHSITPGICVRDADKAIAFFKQAFGAEERMILRGPDGKLAHGELSIGDSIFTLGEASEQMPPFTMNVMLYVQDCDAVFKRALDAGATVVDGLTDQFWGDRTGRLADPFGNRWYIATHKEDVSPEEMDRRMKAMMSG